MCLMSFSQFDKGITAATINAERKRYEANERALILHDKWHESERRLNILRSIPAVSVKPTLEVMERWQKRIKQYSR